MGDFVHIPLHCHLNYHQDHNNFQAVFVNRNCTEKLNFTLLNYLHGNHSGAAPENH